MTENYRQSPSSSISNSLSNSYFDLPQELDQMQHFQEFKTHKSITNSYNFEDLYKIIEVQQKTINKLTVELTKKSQTIPRNIYEQTLNDLETEKYEHAKTKLELIETKDKLNFYLEEIEFFKSELEKERCAYGNVFELLKDKALNEGTKSIDLISKIAETEIRYHDAVQDIMKKEKRYNDLCNKIKEKEQNYEDKVQELNLNLEQDKYINEILNQNSKFTKKMQTK